MQITKCNACFAHYDSRNNHVCDGLMKLIFSNYKKK